MRMTFERKEIVQINGPYHLVICKLKDETKAQYVLKEFRRAATSTDISTCIHDKEHHAVEHRDKQKISGGVSGLTLNRPDKVRLFCTKCSDWKYD